MTMPFMELQIYLSVSILALGNSLQSAVLSVDTRMTVFLLKIGKVLP